MVRAPDCGSGGRWFDPSQRYHWLSLVRGGFFGFGRFSWLQVSVLSEEPRSVSAWFGFLMHVAQKHALRPDPRVRCGFAITTCIRQELKARRMDPFKRDAL
ncbi:hypothetical protein MES4922_40272 [Mesorhizobium ventifaucium]|uniref:Uncharacterized protein n=1 Tax=Mesorhizobium ventifaucium TaxID=666020 RepID=A0ABN8KA32_9HYPH|nr:hypothetical protein MES4922_40272 [Mesorhizobium ventifaucium]